jgi:hypothetical protein
MFLVIALEFLRRLMEKMVQESRQALNDDRESLGESRDSNKIGNVSIRVSTMLVNEDVSNDPNGDKLGS